MVAKVTVELEWRGQAPEARARRYPPISSRQNIRWSRFQRFVSTPCLILACCPPFPPPSRVDPPIVIAAAAFAWPLGSLSAERESRLAIRGTRLERATLLVFGSPFVSFYFRPSSLGLGNQSSGEEAFLRLRM